MCVIAYKPMDTGFMPKSVLQECFRNNPDGAGFMFSADGKVHIRKGYMNFADFWKALSAVRNQYGEKIPYVMHFRISTQAGVNQQCCHPFPLSSDMENLKKLSSSSKIGIAHNGIIRLTSNPMIKDYNDTMKFITDYVTLLIKSVDWWKNPNVSRALETLCGSKLAIMGCDSHVELIGDFIKDGGCYYSNTSYKQPKKPKNYVPNIYEEDWDFFYNEKTGKYDFDDDYCPLIVEGDPCFCEECLHCEHCRVLESCLREYPEEFGFDGNEPYDGLLAG